MAWPSAADFSDAVQNPALAFRDPELRGGHPELDQRGFPKPRSGGFAVVFKLQCRSKNWAVKCFTHDFADQQQRYTAISDYLAQKRLPYTVGFSFLADGITIRGRPYPILKMEWVEGESLRQYVERHLSQPQALRALALRWAAMIKALQTASIAHGDLQDQNVIVVQGDLHLIDYDGMFVPPLAGRGSHELGARHYQHPRRTEGDFGPYVDNFSAWVVYLSLVALSVQPELWQRFSGDDDKLLLSCDDYKEPDKSAVLRTLEASPDQQVRTIARLFRSMVYLRPQDIPSLDGQIKPTSIVSGTDASSWIDDYVPWGQADGHNGQGADGVAPDDTTAADLSWIIEGISQQEGVQGSFSFEHSPIAERTSMAVSMAGVGIVVVLWHLGFLGYYPVAAAAVFVSAFNALLLTARYLSDDSVKAARKVAGEAKRSASVARGKESELEKGLREAEKTRRAFTVQEAMIGKKREDIHRQEDKEVLELRASSGPPLQSVNSRRLAANTQHADDLAKLRDTVGRKISTLDRQISEVDSAESQELGNALQDLQFQHMRSFLSRFPIVDAEIPKVGRSFRLRVATNGFRTAADIDARVITVPGIGPVRAGALQAWKRSLEARARMSAPKGIPPTQEAAMRAKYQRRREVLRTERDIYQRLLVNEERSIRARNEASLAALANEEERLRSDLADKQAEIRARWQQQAAILDQEEKKARQQCEEDLRKNSKQVTQLRKELFRTNWEAAKLDRQMQASRNTRFGRYLARIFGV